MMPANLRFPALLLVVLIAACESPSEPRVPAAIAAVSAVQQSATVMGTVPEAPAVRVTTTSGRPVPDVPVTFSGTGEGAALTGFTQRTNSDGVAALTSWQLGQRAQEYIVTARVDQTALSAEFRVTALPDAPAAVALQAQPPALAGGDAPLSPQPVAQITDVHGNATGVAGIPVRALVEGGGAELINAVAITGGDGAARFTGLALRGPPGEYRLRFETEAYGFTTAASPTLLIEDGCGTLLPLDLGLGELRRMTASVESATLCLDFVAARHQGQQFMLLLENLAPTGAFGTALFPSREQSDTALAFTLHALSRAGGATAAVAASRAHTVPERAVNGWDFGSGPIYEVEPHEPPGGVAEPHVVAEDGSLLALSNASANPSVGDTLVLRLEGIPRLDIKSGTQRAVIRHVSPHLVIAEDVRLGTLLRENGQPNTPLPQAVLDSIALEYAAVAAVQGNLLFDGRHNAAVETDPARRVVAVHTLMYANNIWGYTYTTGNYFAFDYWVGTDGSERKPNQTPQRVADNLFMHEVAHMRHFGLLQRSGAEERGNRWLVEGFARFSERLPIAARLLGTTTPSRTGNVRLPRNPAFGNLYFRDDVPTFLNAGSSLYGGYHQSSYIFDYFADHVAARGGDWMAAMRQFVNAAGVATTLDAVTGSWLPGLTFPELVTRARLALYLDDIGTAGLPAWTQYLQFQLRESRPAGGDADRDPRAAWQKLAPGEAVNLTGDVVSGGALGFVIDGTRQTGSARFRLTTPQTANTVVSLVRIR